MSNTIPQFKRNTVVMANRQEAMDLLQDKSKMDKLLDGEMVLISYYSNEEQANICVLLGIHNRNYSTNEHVMTFYDLDNNFAIDDIYEKLSTKNFFIDFSDRTSAVQMYNMNDKTIQLVSVKSANIGKLMITTSDYIKQEVDMSLPFEIKIKPGDVMSWDIERITDNDIASIGIKYKILG